MRAAVIFVVGLLVGAGGVFAFTQRSELCAPGFAGGTGNTGVPGGTGNSAKGYNNGNTPGFGAGNAPSYGAGNADKK